MIGQHLLAGVAVIGLMGAPIWWASDRDPPVDFTISILNPTVAPGDLLHVEYVIDRKRVCEARAVRTIYDGAGVETRFIPDERSAFGNVGPDYRVIELKVPETAAVGIGRYRLASTFVCNPLHKIWPITVVYPDVTFSIAPGVTTNARQSVD